MHIRTSQLDGDVHRIELLNEDGKAFAMAMFRPGYDAESVEDQLLFLLTSAREHLAAHPPKELDWELDRLIPTMAEPNTFTITVTAEWRSYESPAFPTKKITVGGLVGEVQPPDPDGRVDWEVYTDAWPGGFFASGTTDSIAESVTAAESAIADAFASPTSTVAR